ncbi:hypothetical protein BDFB_004713 [Asbolus verrucosus]|uniref:C2H2-type domain-containing protein n=1 Tax=Asbolus verrucosus TaxID=1661398 RepID=A0A482V2M1_ASBVE|nr:hypothetical protein BDFB_004713 [Asbolus verrucosus]
MLEVFNSIYPGTLIEKKVRNPMLVLHECSRPLYETDSIYLVENRTDPLQHYSCVAKGAPEMYRCDSCGFEVYLKVNLKIHTEMVHRLGFDVSLENFCAFSDDNYNLTNILKCHACKNCDFITFSALVLLKHESKQCTYKKRQIPKAPQDLVKFQRSPPEARMYQIKNWFECEECEMKTRFKHQMVRHIELKHTQPEDVRWFSCDQCPFKTRHKGSLKGHKVQHMTLEDIKWFSCSFCSHKSKQKKHLEVHVIAKHTPLKDIKWFQCEHCSYKTKIKSTLRGHVLARHTAPENIKWVYCELCSYKCKRKSQLKQHMSMKGKHKLKI